LQTPDHAHEGGSVIGTSRVEELLRGGDRISRLRRIEENLEDVDILYIIGGDGSMKAAHALYEISCKNANRVRKLSVVAIPKTMDNDVLWVWQSFGFLSAVEKAREVIEHLSTEVQSNPRLCIVQLFGSDSGFVVSHAVLASATGRCVLALIPEIDFSMEGILDWIKEKIRPTDGRPPHGILVMAETAVPTDAMDYQDKAFFELTEDEKAKLEEFDDLRKWK
jgi:6-phosphofructokinase 1